MNILSANLVAVVAQHQRCLNVICEAAHLLIPEHDLEERKDTRSHDAELGDIAKTIFAACAHAEMASSELRRHHARALPEKAATSEMSAVNPAA